MLAKGCVDKIGSNFLSGWVLVPGYDADREIECYLNCDGETTKTFVNIYRKDVCDALNRNGNFGFFFKGDILKNCTKPEVYVVHDGKKLVLPLHPSLQNNNNNENLLASFDIKKSSYDKKLLLISFFSNETISICHPPINLSQLRNEFHLVDFVDANEFCSLDRHVKYDYIYVDCFSDDIDSQSLLNLLEYSGRVLLNIHFVNHEFKAYFLSEDLHYVPSYSTLKKQFDLFAFRRVSGARCLLTPLQKTVTIIRGGSGKGKTVRSEMEAECGSVLIRTDQIFSVLDSSFQRGLIENTALLDLLEGFREHRRVNGKYKGLLGHQHSFAKYLVENDKYNLIASLLVKPISSKHLRYVIEGGVFTNDDFCNIVVDMLENMNCKVWTLT